MAQPVIQTSFNAGEWAPALNARVDLAKYHSGAALLRNFFVDYRGGATTRPGTRYILKARSNSIRLIPFQASFAVTYVLEFGPGYIRPFNNGAPVLENATTISGVTNANPGVITDTAHGYSIGDWIFISNVGGMTQLNGNFYVISSTTTNTYTVQDLYGITVNTTSFGVYTSGGTAQRVVTIFNSPYQAADLFGIKYAQNVNQLILCHPNYPPQLLTLHTATNWTILPISFGPTITTPTGLAVITSGGGTSNVSYTVTAVDSNGQESSPAAPIGVTTASATSTQTVSWNAVTGAVSYNIYRTIFSTVAIVSGQPYGYVGTSTGVSFLDTNITPNFAISAPIITNPFSGAGVGSLTLTAGGSGYTIVPGVAFSGGSPLTAATGHCYLGALNVTIDNGGSYGYGNSLGTPPSTLTLPNGITLSVGTVVGGGGFFVVSTINAITNPGALASGSVPTNPLTSTAPSGVVTNTAATFDVGWDVSQIFLDNPGTGYGSAPAVGFTGGGGGSGAAATAALGAASAGNPSVPGFAQQRSFFGGPILSPSQFNMSQPGAPFNFNVTFPAQADNAIQETLTNTVLNSIKSIVTVSAGMIIFTDKGAVLVNGGSPGAPFSALQLVANPQSYSGAGDLPPIVTPQDVLYVQAKGSIVRDLAFNFYLNNYIGADISVLSSHLFYSYNLTQWTWAEEPFKVVWAVRNDGQLLSLTFVKEQELVAWAHSDTNGAFVSIASVNETTSIGNVDAVYVAVQRAINGQNIVYIERMVELTYPNDYKSSWQVDAGIGYSGAAATTFSGAQHLAGASVTGVANGAVINFTMPTTGTFVFGPGGTTGLTGIANASIVTVGLPFTSQIQTLALDLGEPTVQSKRKKVGAVTVRCRQALGLSAGRSFTTLVPMKDLIIGNVGTMSNTVVNGLVTSDARTIVDPQYDVFGQFCIQQSNPYPASVLGVVPEIEVGDSAK